MIVHVEDPAEDTAVAEAPEVMFVRAFVPMNPYSVSVCVYVYDIFIREFTSRFHCARTSSCLDFLVSVAP